MKIAILEFVKSEFEIDYDNYANTKYFYKILPQNVEWYEVSDEEYDLLRWNLDRSKYVIVQQMPKEQIASKLADFIAIARKQEKETKEREAANAARKAKRLETKLKQKDLKDIQKIKEAAKKNGFKLVKDE